MTAPTTEVVGIYGISTNAVPPQGDYFMASMLTVPDFTHRTSICNLISGVLRSSLTDLPESILLLVARARQVVIGNLSIYRRGMQILISNLPVLKEHSLQSAGSFVFGG